MAITYRGPSGTTYQFPDGTPHDVAMRFIADQERRKDAGGKTIAAAMARKPEKRSALERLGDVFKDTYETSWVAAGYREGYARVAQSNAAIKAWEAGGRKGPAPAAPERSFLENPMSSVGQIVASVQGIGSMVGLAPKDAIQADAKVALDTERARRADFATKSAEDPFWKADGGFGGKALHGAAALVGVLGGAAVDPISYVSGGRTILTRALTQGALAGGIDVMAQGSDVDAGLQDSFDVKRLAFSAAGGAGFTALGEVAQIGAKKWGQRFFRSAEGAVGEALQEADEIAAPALSAAELPDLRAPVSEQLDLFDMPEPGPRVGTIVEPEARPMAAVDAPEAKAGPGPDGPEAAGAGPAGDPEVDFFGLKWKSDARREAAVRHLETLRATVKPEHLTELFRYAARGLDPVMPDGDARVGFINQKWVDWSKLDETPERILALTNAIGEIFTDTFAKAGREKVTFDQIARTAKLHGSTATDIARAHSNITSNGGLSAQLYAMNEVAIGSTAETVRRISEVISKIDGKTKTDLDVLEVGASIERTVMLSAMAKGADSEVARALAVLRRVKQARTMINDLEPLLADVMNNGRTMSDDKLKDVLKSVKEAYEKGGAASAMNRLRLMRKWGIADYAGYLANGALLSAPVTFIRNVAGPTWHALDYMADRYIAAGLGAARRAAGVGPSDAVTGREAVSYMAAYFQSIPEAASLAAQAFRKGTPLDAAGSWNMPGQSSFVPFEVTPERLGRMKDKPLSLSTARDALMLPIFSATRLTAYRPMLAADTFFKTLGFRAELTALAHREAAYRTRIKGGGERVYKEVMESILKEPTAEAIDSARAFFRENQLSPEGIHDFGSQAEEYARVLRSFDVHQLATDHANALVFQKSGELADRLDRTLRVIPLVKFGFVNFVRTPMAIIRAASIDRNPVLAGLHPENRAKLAPLFQTAKRAEEALARGGAEADIVVAKMLAGTALISIAWMLFADKRLTGPRGGWGDAEQQDGVLPYSVKIGDTWHQFNTFEPLATQLRLVASVAEAMRERDLSDDEGDTAMGLLMAGILNATEDATTVGLAATEALVAMAMFQGVQDFMVAVTGENAPGGTQESKMEASMKAWTRAISARALPLGSLQASITREVDPVRREPDGLIEAFMSRIPLLSDTLPARRDFFGRVEVIPEGQRGLLQAIPTSHQKNDPLALEISRLATTVEGFALKKPTRRFNEKEITFEEYGRLLELQGQIVLHPETGKNMEDTLRAVVQSPDYLALPDPARAAAIQKWTAVFRELGRDAAKDPSSPLYMREMVKRTGTSRFKEEAAKSLWSPAQATKKARSYGLTPDDMGALQEALTPN